ncbi:lipocalin family protein [Flagellimonas onchidii]|uniref:lipocalin family protein n=1 Tax=Flagellimonas onchidii TaxID=2562684 RepID=UPI0010A61CE7|nr:lipocalin family protein [Allomuricauda onchidii]
MNRILLFGTFILLFSCKESLIPKENLHYLNGYWEISEVTFPDGSKKDYKISSTIDFIHLDGDSGFRKKMQPKFNGTYSTSNNVESFTMIKTNDVFTLTYKNSLDQWDEKLIQLDSTSFAVRNEEGILYSYKRFQPIQIPK